MRQAAQNDAYTLYYDAQTLAVALLDRRDGKVYFSNPYNAAADPYCSGDVGQQMNSQVVLEYVDFNNTQKNLLFSAHDCVELGQFALQDVENGFDVLMTLGEMTKIVYLPPAMRVESFEQFTAKMGDRAKSRMEIFYTLTTLDEADPAERRRLQQDFPALSKGPLYIAQEELSDKEQRDISEYLVEAGYTDADYQLDCALGGDAAQREVNPEFTLRLQYRLTPDGLSVTVPADSVSFNRDAFALLNIRLLEFFGADVADPAGSGYLFLPDGSGALIRMDDSNVNRRRTISGEVYGADVTVQNEALDKGEQFFLPVFGTVRQDGGCLFAQVTTGDEISTVTAALGAPSSRYFRVYNTFRYQAYDRLTINTKVNSQGTQMITFVANDLPYARDMTVLYTPLSGGAGYLEMAALYRSRLQAMGMKETAENCNFAAELELLGAVRAEDTVLGIPVQRNIGLTTFDQARELTEWFSSKGVGAMRVLYSGWQKNGLNAGVAGKQTVSGTLGGGKKLRKLNADLAARGVELLPAVDPIFCNYQYLFDGYSSNRDTARDFAEEFAGVPMFENRVTDDTLRQLISPARYAKFWNKLKKSVRKLDAPALMLDSLGRYLVSDTKREQNGSRIAAMDAMLEIFGDDWGKALWTEGANAFLLPLLSGVTAAPLHHSNFPGETAQIPFYELATDGLVARSSSAVNLADDWEQELLTCVETHTSPRFTLAYGNVAWLKNSDFTQYYSVSYEILRDRIAEDLANLQRDLACVDGARLTDHQILADGVTRSGFSNGVQILVNKTDAAYTFEGNTVPAMGYTVLQKEVG